MDRDKIRDYHVRLYERDQEELKRRAKETGASWVAYLRVLVQRALKHREIMK